MHGVGVMFQTNLAYKVFAAACLVSSVAVARPQASTAAHVFVRPSATGNVALRIDTVGLSPVQVSELLRAVPQELHCRWAGRQRNPHSIEGICRSWLVKDLDSGSAILHLAPLTARVHKLAERVTFELTLTRSPNNAAPAGWNMQHEEGSAATRFLFVSGAPENVPSDFPIHLETPIPLTRILSPIAFVLLIPGLVACAVRFRASRKPGGVNWIVWTSWINLGAWLYWISAMSAGDLGEFMVGAWFDSYLATFTVAALLYSMPPLVSVAISVTILSPLMTRSGALGTKDWWMNLTRMLKRKLIGEAVLMAPLGVFLVGVGLSSAGWGYAMFGLVVAYVTFRILVWFHWSQNYAAVTPLESGELFQGAVRLAKKAGVTIARLSLLRTTRPEEANAFATSGDAIMLTEGLVNALPVREVNAVIAHELGHHKAGHLRFNPSRLLFWAYMLGAEPGLSWLIHHFQAPHWLMTLPIAPLLFMMLQSYLSQRREFEADTLGVQFTGDPEAAIAALARMAKLSQVPTTLSSLSGSIMSHPSIEGRGLALARRFGISECRALEILADPNALYDESASARHEACVASPSLSSIFSLRQRALVSEQLRWLRLFAPLAGGCLVAVAMTMSSFFFTGTNMVITAVAGSAVVLGLTLWAEILWTRRISSRLHFALASRLQPVDGAVFVGLHPGHGVRFTEGFADWDFGFLTIEGDWLCYRGEKTRFSIARQDISGIEIAKGPINWLREHRVEVSCSDGAFTLSSDVACSNRTKTARIAKGLKSWVCAAASEAPVGCAPEPAPALPKLPGIETTRVSGVLVTCTIGVKLVVAAGLTAILAWYWIPSSIIFLVPLAGILRMLPRALWPVRRPAAGTVLA